VTPRFGITLADQIVSSASNLLVVLAVARISGIAEFGAFSLAFLVYQMALGLMRAGAGDVLLIRSATVESLDQDPHRALSFVLVFAVPVAAATGIAGLLADGAFGKLLTMVAIVLVPVLLEDCYRYVFFARSSPRNAIVIDTVWLLTQLTGFVLAAAGTLPETTAGLMLIWGASAGLACLCGAALAKVLPGLNGVAWVRAARHRVVGLMTDFMLLSGTTYVGFGLIPLVGSLSTVAALRGALLLFNPLLAFLTSIRVIALPTLTRRLAEGPWSYRGFALRLSAALSGLAIVYASIILLLPDSVGIQLLGNSWHSVNAILLPVSLAYLAGAVSYPAMEGLRALGNARRLIATRAAGAVLMVVGLIAGSALSGAMGGAIGMCAARWGTALLWQMSLRASLVAQPASVKAEPVMLAEDVEVEEELILLDGENLP
jgi:O-antigen/teichoic acid export membrane protein